jgi:hypothetical protein
LLGLEALVGEVSGVFGGSSTFLSHSSAL